MSRFSNPRAGAMMSDFWRTAFGQKSGGDRKIMQESHARFTLGQLVHHRLFDYRGVIVDVDPFFLGSEEWYEQVARTRPPKNEPWYHVLVDNAEHQTYVAERNLELDPSKQPVNHPQVPDYFDAFREGLYLPRRRGN